ncbi:MAG: hypothetical protein BMS9Abin20_1403 [Acidimicrobiia bacterium]|nr:MAG: hypothetical protein BMS9Abin20_1403 [Acidimicrobiia bacterium]
MPKADVSSKAKASRAKASKPRASKAKASSDAAAGSEVLEQANEEAKQLLAKSRYDAFRLVIEAREEAETILDEARAEAAGTLKAATITAESKIDVAELNAAEIIDKAQERAATVIESAQERPSTDATPDTTPTALKAEHQELSDQVDSLRALASQLEERFAALAESTPPGFTSSELEDSSTGNGKPTLDYSPSVPRNDTSHEPDPVPPKDVDRGSFYSRRSAKLPRIGEAGGKSAFDMTRNIRSKLDAD